MKNLEEFFEIVLSKGGKSIITIEVTERILRFSLKETKIKYYFRFLWENSETIEYVPRRLVREFPFLSEDIEKYRMRIMGMALKMALKIFERYEVSSKIKFSFIQKEFSIQEIEEEIKRRFETSLKKTNGKINDFLI
jgi:hypothetical protein